MRLRRRLDCMDSSPTLHRRTVLTGAGTAAAGSIIALAGCGDPQEEEGPGEEGAPDQPDAHEDDGGAIDDGDDDAEHTPTPPDDAVEEDTDAAEHPDDDEDQADDDQDQADDGED